MATSSRIRYQQRGVIAALLVALASGCSGASADHLESDTLLPQSSSAFDTYVATVVGERTKESMSEAQRELLLSAIEIDSMTVDLATRARDNFFACLDDAGIWYSDEGTSGPPSHPSFEYLVEDDETTNALAEQCYSREFQLVDIVYQTQPSVQSSNESKLEANRAALIACVNAHGRSLDSEATLDELRPELIYLLTGYDPRDEDPVENPGHQAVDCLGEVGMTASDL